MGRKGIIVLLLAGILLVGCTGPQKGTPEGSPGNPELKSGEEKVPARYLPQDAVKEGHIVIVHGNMESDPSRLEGFIERTQGGGTGEVSVVQYTVEGDPILTKVQYDGEAYRGVEDTTRDRFGEQGYREFAFSHLKVFKNGGRRMVILVDDDSLTLEKYMESIASSQSDHRIPHHFLLSYEE